MKRIARIIFIAVALSLLSHAAAPAPNNASQADAEVRTPSLEDDATALSDGSQLLHQASIDAVPTSEALLSNWSIETITQIIMAATSVAAVLISIWAVFLLSRTLKATRDAVEAADAAVEVTQRFGIAQSRAYLTFKGPNARVMADSQTRQFTGVELKIEVMNSGQSPCSITQIYTHAVGRKIDTIGQLEVRLPSYGQDDIACAPGHNINGRVMPLSREMVNASRRGEIDIFHLGYVRYRDAFYPETEEHIETQCTHIKFNSNLDEIDPEIGLTENAIVFTNIADYRVELVEDPDEDCEQDQTG